MLFPRGEFIRIPQFEHEDAVGDGRVSEDKGVSDVDA